MGASGNEEQAHTRRGSGAKRGADETIGRLQRVHALGKLVGDAPAFRAVVARLPLVARAIHYLSSRERGAFTAVNCGSLPDTLLEDELFGHERGAYTDARSARPGLLRQSHGGTLLLDEVDSLSPRAQVALLRVLQDRSYRALGSSEERFADVRIIAATNGDLWELVQQRTFRSDLYYRLSVLTVALPPLRERREDILPLTHHFLLRYAGDERALQLTAEAKRVLLDYPWPGNIRELENAVLRAVSLCEGDVIRPADLGLRAVASLSAPTAAPAVAATSMAPTAHPAGITNPTMEREVAIDLSRSFGDLKREVLDRFERDYLEHLMRRFAGNVTQAARQAGKERRDFRRLLHKHSIAGAGSRN
jgi:DNA-binding NtrC family response regulator